MMMKNLPSRFQILGVLLFSIALLAPLPEARASEGFIQSSFCQVLFYRGRSSGATMSWVSLPKMGKVLLTQFHVIDNMTGRTTLSFGYKSGPFFMRSVSKTTEAQAWEIEFDANSNILLKDEALDIAILKPTPEIKSRLRECEPWIPSSTLPETMRLVGYPITARRTYPLKGKFFAYAAEPFGTVTQKTSSGKIWKDANGELMSDADALPGDSGGPIIDEKNQVIGVLKHLEKSWYGNGYQYQNPQISVIPIDQILRLSTQK